MKILGLSYGFHDAAACLVVDGVPVAAAEEERFTRIKHDAAFPHHAIRYCLSSAGLSGRALDGVAFYEKPARKLERILQTAKRYEPQSAVNLAGQFHQAVTEGLCVEDRIRAELDYVGPVYFSEHHRAHAASAFFCSPFEESAILTVDGVGEWTTTGQFLGSGNRIEKQRDIRYPHSLGLLYSTLTAFLGFAVNDDEYKIMGLASFGTPRFRHALEQLVEMHADGSFSLQLSYFSFMYDDSRMYTPELERLLGPARHPSAPIEARHRDIAASLQAMTEELMVGLARACRGDAPRQNLCLAGGVALNCVVNSQVAQRAGFDALFIQPAAGDSGAAMGAALWVTHELLGLERHPGPHDTLLGPAYSEAEILASLRTFDLDFVRLDEEALCRRVAALIHDDLIIGWFQGRMEFGPRALGGRSILANPCSPETKDILNSRVKFREEFRPFAPAVTEEAAASLFELDDISPFMLQAPRVRPEKAAAIPAVTHVDGTARVQTVSARRQPLFHRLLRCFGELSGVPVLVNTSFNVRGEPIVCSPSDAIRCFLGTDIDFLGIGPFLVSKL
jgi:carbamoyltransferase